MASPTVQAYGGDTDTSSPLTVTLPGTPADNDLYLIFLANSAGGSWILSSGTGWTELYDANGNACYYKKVSASESNPSFAWTGGGRAVWEAYRITGAIDPATQAPEASAGASGSDQYPDPDSISRAGARTICLSPFRSSAAT